VYSLEYTKIPKVFFTLYITGDDISRATKGMTNSTMISKATVISKVILATIRSKVIIAAV
jgi:hypothetical protein